MSDRYPSVVRQQNNILRAELGENPRYAWRWSEDLMHVLEVLDLDGNPLYVQGKTPSGIVTMVPKTATKKLLPQHHDQWVVCALVEVNEADGSLNYSRNHSWIPLSGPSGVVCLPENEVPSITFTQSVIDAIRLERSHSPAEFGAEWEELQRKKEKDRWNRIYDQIRSEATAFCNVPGLKAHVSFPSVQQVN